MELNSILRTMTYNLGFKIIASCPGYVQERFVKPSVQPSILFKHSERSLDSFIVILKNLGFNMKKLNEVLRSRFSSTGELEWVFMMPDSLFKINSEADIEFFWTAFNEAVENTISLTN